MSRIVTVRPTRVTPLVAIVVGAVLVALPATGRGAGTQSAVSQLVIGKRLYRQYCGQCHALSAALSAGFGNSNGGLGLNGGPSFNDLRIPYSYSVDAVSEPTGGHELVRKRITMTQLGVVANYVAKVTDHNPIPALPTDG